MATTKRVRKRAIGSKRAIADFIHKWEKLTTNVARNAAELPAHIQQYAAPLLEVLAGLQEIEAAKQNRRAVKQQEVKDSTELLRSGQDLAEKLQSVIIGHHGRSSERLIGYGLKPRRPRRSRPSGGTPEPDAPGEPPEEKPEPQAGQPSKPAEQVTEGAQTPEAAEQPKPEDPAPAPSPILLLNRPEPYREGVWEHALPFLRSTSMVPRGPRGPREEVAVMAREKPIDVRFEGPMLAQIEEIERLSGKSIPAILSESVNLWNWWYKERLNGGQLLIQGPDPDAPPLEVVFT